MRIGELARRVGTTTRALRFYGAQGLLPARRSTNGYRKYDEGDFRLVNEIMALWAVGFSLDDTRPFLECPRSGHETGGSCRDSIGVYRREIGEVDALVDRLGAVRASLAVKLDAALARRSLPCVVAGADGAEPEEGAW